MDVGVGVGVGDGEDGDGDVWSGMYSFCELAGSVYMLADMLVLRERETVGVGNEDGGMWRGRGWW